MKISIDISQIIYQTGVSVYTENLVKNLLEIDQVNKYKLFGFSLRQFNYFHKYSQQIKKHKEQYFYPLPISIVEIIANRIHILPIDLLVGDSDIIHTSDWVEPPTSSLKVTTVHDFAPFIYPQYTHPKIRAVHTRKFKWVKAEVNKIIVPSLSTKIDAIKYGLEESRIEVIHEAPDEFYKKASDNEVETVLSKYKIEPPYLITTGVGGRKNTKNLIRAFKRVAKKIPNLKLVLVGQGSDKFKDSEINSLGFVPKTDMPALYSGAECFVYPSLYEGFGIPILEAFACGCPVACSNTSSLPEVGGNAAVYFNPIEIEDIEISIEKIYKERKERSRESLRRAKAFNWIKTAEETLKVYNSLL